MSKQTPRRRFITRPVQRPFQSRRVIEATLPGEDDEFEDQDEELDEGDPDDDDREEVERVDIDVYDPLAPGEEEYTAGSYKAEQRLDLPSGRWVRIRPVSLISMIRNKIIPNELLAAARRMVGLDQPAKTDKAKAAFNDDTVDVMDFLVMQMIASFKCVNKPPEDCGDDEVSVSSILECDKTAITNYAMKGQRALKSFRAERRRVQ